MKKLITIMIILLMASMCFAGACQDGTISVGTSASGVTVSCTKAKSMLISVDTGAVRVGFKTAPTSTTGILLYPGDTMNIYGAHDIASFRVIRNSGVSTANVRYVLFTKDL